ncbi:MAG: hypothetical protein RIQ90_66 [Bacteroidota bacterium]
MKFLKKSALFIVLIIVLGGILLFRNQIKSTKTEIKITERLPDGEIIGQMNFIDLSKEIQGILFNYKLPVREFASADFILSQAKNSGINLNSHVYFFANPNAQELGFMVSVVDSSKLKDVITRFQKTTTLIDSSQNGHRIYHLPKLKLSLAYEKTYLFVYLGTQFNTHWLTIRNTKPGGIKPQWRRFMESPVFKTDRLVFYTESPRIKEWGCDYAIFAHDNDSSEVTLKYYVHTATPHGLSVANQGKVLPKQESDLKQIDLHVNPQFFESTIGLLVKKKAMQYAKKINFPLLAFLEAWQGNFSFREGGSVTVTEKIIESQFDQDFNVIEVVRYKTSTVPGYSVLFDLNKKGTSFQNTLLSKGLLRAEQNKWRFLFSPLLNYSSPQPSVHLYSSSETPLLLNESLRNEFSWEVNGSKIRGGIDQIHKNAIQGSIKVEAPFIINYLQNTFKNNKKLLF